MENQALMSLRVLGCFLCSALSLGISYCKIRFLYGPMGSIGDHIILLMLGFLGLADPHDSNQDWGIRIILAEGTIGLVLGIAVFFLYKKAPATLLQTVMRSLIVVVVFHLILDLPDLPVYLLLKLGELMS